MVRRNNPLVQKRKKHPKHAEDEALNVIEVSSGRGELDDWAEAVSAVSQAGTFYSDTGRFIDVRSTAEKVGFTEDDPEGAELHIYIVETRLSDEIQRGPEERGPKEAEEDWLERSAEWTKENATSVIHGEVHDFRNVLRRLMLAGHGDAAFNQRIPVQLTDRDNPDGLMMTLNAALLTTHEREIYDAIMQGARWVRHYNETNSDSTDGMEQWISGEADNVFQGEMFVIGPNGHGWVEGRHHEARKKLMNMVALCRENDALRNDRHHSPSEELAMQVNELMKGYNISWWCFSDPEDKKRPDYKKDYTVMDYETEDMVEDELPDDIVSKATKLTDEEHAHVAEALERNDVNWDWDNHRNVPERRISVGDVNAHWVFTIDVDQLIDEMIEEFPELGEDYEEPDEDEDEDENEDDEEDDEDDAEADEN